MADPQSAQIENSAVSAAVLSEAAGRQPIVTARRSRLRWNVPLALGLVIVSLSVGIALAAPWLSAHDPLDIADASLSPPSVQYLLGTDQLGRDVLARILYATRTSLSVACLSAALAFGSGTFIGVLAGYSGGLVDACLMRLLDVLQAFPPLLLAIALVAALGPNLPNLVLTMGVLFMPRLARVARASTLSVRERDYVAAAIGLGVTPLRTMFRHVLPNIATPLVIEASLTATLAILTEASLSFLGLGVQPPDPTWGGMIAESTSVMSIAPWLAISPGSQWSSSWSASISSATGCVTRWIRGADPSMNSEITVLPADLHWASAWQIRDAIVARQLSATEVTRHFLTRIEALDPRDSFIHYGVAGARARTGPGG